MAHAVDSAPVPANGFSVNTKAGFGVVENRKVRHLSPSSQERRGRRWDLKSISYWVYH